MIKKLLYFCVITMAIVTSFVVYEKVNVPPPESHLTRPIIPPNIQPKVSDEALQILDNVNRKNEAIRSFSCEDARIYIWHNGLRLTTSSKIYYEKEKRFNMDVTSLVGDEFLMGSNDQEFWFWSKRMNPSVLHYAKHEDLNKTRLKSPFNPLGIIESFGIHMVNVKEPATIIEQNKSTAFTGAKIVIVEPMFDTIGLPVVKMTYIDRQTQRITGNMLTTQDGKLIASAEILDWSDDLPRQIVYTWEEENRVMMIEFPTSKKNVKLNPRLWKKPSMEGAIDMSKD